MNIIDLFPGSANSLKKISMQENQDIQEMEELIESQADSLLSSKVSVVGEGRGRGAGVL